MKKSTLILLGVMVANLTFAQKRVALNSFGTTTIYSGSQPYVDAYNDAVDGDTLYLPGGQLTSPAAYDKRLTIYGAGLRADTSIVTEKTQISGFTLNAGADNFHIEGTQINGNINFATNIKIDSVLLKRIRVSGDINVSGTNQECDGFKLKESVVQGTVILTNANSPEITNNLIRFVRDIENGYIANNIIVNVQNTSTRILTNIHQSLLENNYIANLYISSSFSANCTNNSFNNNAFNIDPTADSFNSWSGNFVSIAPVDLFVDFSMPFNELANYNLIDPATYQGTTGNEIGIYGGLFPAKEGFMPENPHYQLKNIAPQTNTNGELQIEITIEAQNE